MKFVITKSFVRVFHAKDVTLQKQRRVLTMKTNNGIPPSLKKTSTGNKLDKTPYGRFKTCCFWKSWCLHTHTLKENTGPKLDDHNFTRILRNFNDDCKLAEHSSSCPYGRFQIWTGSGPLLTAHSQICRSLVP